MRWSFLITCEHAGWRLPDGTDLGLDEAVLRSHVSYDRGAREIAEALAPRLEAPLHLGSYSRLWVDLNRREENPAVIAAETYGLVVPGNVALDAEDREARIARAHRPYRQAARADAKELASAGRCFHLSVHSFDPSLDPERRAFDAGVLFDPSREPERSLSEALATALSGRGHTTRLNEPYTGTPEGLTSWLRDELPPERYVGLEIEACYRWMGRPGALDAFATDLASAARDVVWGAPAR